MIKAVYATLDDVLVHPIELTLVTTTTNSKEVRLCLEIYKGVFQTLYKVYQNNQQIRAYTRLHQALYCYNGLE